MAVSNPPTLSSIIAEFGTNGSPTNLYAYRRGGGIIGDDFPGVGQATPGSDLKISQFAGLSAVTDWLGAFYIPNAGLNMGGLSDSIKMDSAGNVYAVGITGQGGFESITVEKMIVAKISPSGTPFWVREIYGNSLLPSNLGPSINLDSAGNIYLATSAMVGNDNGFFACKLDNNGNMYWSRHITGGNGSDFAFNSCIDGAGSIYIVGGTYEGAPSGYLSAVDGYVVKLDTNGNIVWQATHRTNDENYFNSCWTDGTYLYITGEYNWFGGIQLFKLNASNGGFVANWYYVNSRSGYGSGITGDNQGYIYLQGNCSDPSYYYPIVMKVNASTGAVVWQKWFEAYGDGPNWAIPMRYDPATGYLFTGLNGSTTLLCLNASNGSTIFEKYLGAGGGGKRYGIDVNNTTLAINSGYYYVQQYQFSSGWWRIARVPKSGAKSGTWNTSPTGYSVTYDPATTGAHTVLNGNATLKNGGGSYLGRSFVANSTDAVSSYTYGFEKVKI